MIYVDKKHTIIVSCLGFYDWKDSEVKYKQSPDWWKVFLAQIYVFFSEK
jgi:hypothetical protein